VPLPAKEVARDRVLDDTELAQVILAARKIGGPYGGIVELLALTGQRRQEVAGLRQEEVDLAQRIWTIPKARTKNAKAHIVHLSKQALAVLKRTDQREPLVLSPLGNKTFQNFTNAKHLIDQLSGVTGWRLHDLRRTCVSGMARLGVAPHIADKILNHQSGTISGVAAVYQRHEFLSERRAALDLWGAHVGGLLKGAPQQYRIHLKSPSDRLPSLISPSRVHVIWRSFERGCVVIMRENICLHALRARRCSVGYKGFPRVP
jgi:integrase